MKAAESIALKEILLTPRVKNLCLASAQGILTEAKNKHSKFPTIQMISQYQQAMPEVQPVY